MAKKLLCVLRAGSGSIHPTWLPRAVRHVDVAISTYGDGAFQRTEITSHRHHFNGSKLGGVQNFLNENPSVLDEYSYFWFVEDDLFIPERTVRLVAQFAELDACCLFAPSVSGDSDYNHAITVSNRAFTVRAVDFVEQMCPVFSRTLLRKTLPMFSENYSGWGYEWFWQRRVNEDGGTAAILDCASIYHTRPSGSGSLYSNAPQGGLTRLQEADAFLKKHNLPTPVTNLAAISLDHNNVRILSERDLRERIPAGYSYLANLNSDGYRNCVALNEAYTASQMHPEVERALSIFAKMSGSDTGRTFLMAAAA